MLVSLFSHIESAISHCNMAMQYSYMEKYEALHHYFGNFKPNFWQAPSVSDSLYLKLQKFTHFGLFGHIGSAIFYHNESENFPRLQNLKYAINIFNLLPQNFGSLCQE